MHEVMLGGFDKCFKEPHECWQKLIIAEEWFVEGRCVIKGF
jgi:hypothetical protein